MTFPLLPQKAVSTSHYIMSTWKNTKIFNFGESDDLEETNSVQSNIYGDSNQSNTNQNETAESKPNDNNTPAFSQVSNNLPEK